jgi:hypothetical protein
VAGEENFKSLRNRGGRRRHGDSIARKAAMGARESVQIWVFSADSERWTVNSGPRASETGGNAGTSILKEGLRR